MNQLKIAFVLDSSGNLLPAEYKFVIQHIRYCLYELRNSAFDDDCKYSLSFVKYGAHSEVSLYDLDSFSINKQNQDSIFQECDAQNLKDFDCVINYSSTSFEPSQVMKLVKNPPKQKETKSQKTAATEKTTTAPKSEKSKKSAKPLKIIIPTIAVCLILSLLPLLFYLVKGGMSKYQKVYTGDGDRLILRTEPDVSSIELLRLNEGEVVRIVQENDYWSQVEYHDFVGYVKNQYLTKASKKEYKIENPDSLFNYGVACLNVGTLWLDGEPWIKKAAEQDLLQAQWEMKKIKREDTEENLYWLKAIAANGYPYEYTLINEWTQKRDIAQSRGETEIANKYTAKIDERKQLVKDISFAAFTRLADEYLDINPSLAGEYYLESRKWGTDTDLDFLETLVDKFEGDERIKWLEKAYALGSTKAAWELAVHYDETGDYGNAVACYETCYKNYYKRTDAAGYLYKYYKKTNSKEAFKWLERAFSSSYYNSNDYYYFAYYLGDAYENGKGCEVNYYYALSYYKIAKEVYTQAQEAYDRVYYYYYWY